MSARRGGRGPFLLFPSARRHSRSSLALTPAIKVGRPSNLRRKTPRFGQWRQPLLSLFGNDCHLDSIAAVSAAFATDGPSGPTDGTGRSRASAAPACDTDQCPVLAGDGGPGGPTDGTDRSGARMAFDGPSGPGYSTGRSSALLTDDWRTMLAGDGGPTGIGDNNGRSSAALSKGGAEFLVASIKPGQGDF
jgi:hypothetical protein